MNTMLELAYRLTSVVATLPPVSGTLGFMEVVSDPATAATATSAAATSTAATAIATAATTATITNPMAQPNKIAVLSTGVQVSASQNGANPKVCTRYRF